MKIAIIGPRGRLGSELVRRGCLPLDLDITNEEEIKQNLQEISGAVDAVVNCAAFSFVDGAESEPGKTQAFAVNMHGVRFVRQNWEKYLIHISTGFVFPGDQVTPYDEDDEPRPVNDYGFSKWGGEAMAHMRQPSLVVRTLDLFGPHTEMDHVKSVLVDLEKGEPFSRRSDMWGQPTYIPALADAILEFAARGTLGTIHYAGETALTRADFARMIAKTWGFDEKLVSDTGQGLPGSAKRPQRAILGLNLCRDMGITLLSAQDALNLNKALMERL